LASLLGEVRAQEIVVAHDVNRGIYATVVRDRSIIESILSRYSTRFDAADSSSRRTRSSGQNRAREGSIVTPERSQRACSTYVIFWVPVHALCNPATVIP
jgi:hypothetical protein